jgi:putative ABC transport system substrate-binding protein
MKRRRFITLAGSVAIAWPLAAAAQRPAMPVIGFLAAPSPAPYQKYAAAFRQGLREVGYVEGQNTALEYRWADGHYDRLPTMAAELAGRKVAVIAAVGGTPVVLAARSATATIPIIFVMGDDPVRLGLVASLSRPGGNVTGVSLLAVALEAKRMELLREMVPGATLIAMLVNQSNPQAEIQSREVQKAARAIGQQVHIVSASTERELEAAFVTLVEKRAGALMISADTFFTSQAAQLGALTTRHAIPAISPWRDHVEAGSLMSYGTSLTDAYRQAGVYAGRILKGAKPADLPVVQPTKFELVVNLKTAKKLGLAIPRDFLARVDEVIE